MGFLKKIKNVLLEKLAKRLLEQNFITTEVIVGNNCHISGARLEGKVVLGKNCKVHQAHLDGNIHIGNNTSVWGPNIRLTAKFHAITIGNFCSIARNVSIQEYNHKIDTTSTYHIHANVLNESIMKDLYSNGPITIGHDVWIGAGAVILSGISIGNGAVIGANALISKDVPPYAIVGGNPAQVIRYRFDETKRNKLETLQWWNWTSDEIKNNRSLFE